MPKPIVAIVGRPNVGKSTLYNKIIGERAAIVDDTPGVTRDRLYAHTEWLNAPFTVVDTGGLYPDGETFIEKQVFKQAQIAIETSNVILFLTDGHAGVTESDKIVAQMLRKNSGRVLLVVNKIDSPQAHNPEVYDFYSLGLGDPIAISAGQALGLGDLLDKIIEKFPKEIINSEENESVKIAIIGRPNAGKSSLVNKLLGQERVIVSDVPGTTRDSIDATLNYGGAFYTLIDTAGIRRKSKIHENLERYSVLRAMAAAERADVVCVLIDGAEGITEQDAKIAGIAHESGKPVIITINKWDLVEKDAHTMRKFEKEIETEFAYMSYAQKLFISAISGRRANKLYALAQKAYKNSNRRITTGLLNEVIIEAAAIHQPPSNKGKTLRLYYATQVSVCPPTFAFFVNEPKLMNFGYKRFLENRIREAFDFDGTPIHMVIRKRE